MRLQTRWEGADIPTPPRKSPLRARRPRSPAAGCAPLRAGSAAALGRAPVPQPLLRGDAAFRRARHGQHKPRSRGQRLPSPPRGESGREKSSCSLSLQRGRSRPLPLRPAGSAERSPFPLPTCYTRRGEVKGCRHLGHSGCERPSPGSGTSVNIRHGIGAPLCPIPPRGSGGSGRGIIYLF